MDTTPMPVSDHRKSGWTLWREIYGTFIGLLPLLVVISGVAWTVIRDTDRHTLEIFYLQQADKRHEEQMTALRLEQASIRLEIIGKMDKIGNQIEELQKQVARAMR